VYTCASLQCVVSVLRVETGFCDVKDTCLELVTAGLCCDY